MPLAAPARRKVPAADGFDALFMAEYGRVVGIAQRVLGERAEAEDVAQEVFASFHRKRSPDAPHAARWLHAAAAHTALNVIRSRKRRDRREQAHAELATAAFVDPARSAEVAEQRSEVRAALARIPQRSAAVLALRYSGLSYAEVAAALGIKVDQVGTRLRRAEEAFRKELTRGTSE